MGRRSERGAVILEFALVAIVMLAVMLGVVQYGYLYWSLSTASATAREAARSLSVGVDWACVQERTIDAARSPAIGDDTPLVTRSYATDAGAAQTGPVVGSRVTVTVSFPTLDMKLPFLPVPDGGVVSQSATARIENVPSAALPCDS
jgi:Flp pilus assembly protein TadG